MHLPGTDNSTCQSQPFTIVGATSTNSVSVSWSHNGTGSLTNGNSLTPTYTPGISETGVVTLTLTANSTMPCPAVFLDFMLLTVNASPIAYAGNDASICEGSDFIFWSFGHKQYFVFVERKQNRKPYQCFIPNTNLYSRYRRNRKYHNHIISNRNTSMYPGK